MHKKRSQFIRGIKKGEFKNSIIADHPLIDQKPFYKPKKSKQVNIQSLTLKELKQYGNRIYFECNVCENKSHIDISELINKAHPETTLRKIKNKFYCTQCGLRKFDMKVQL